MSIWPPPFRWRAITGRFWLDLLWLEFLEKVIILILPSGEKLL